MTKEVAKKETTEVSAEVMNMWAPQEVSSSEIIMPKLMVMQGLSELVTDGKAMFGEFRDSLTGGKLGGLDTPFEFIPFHLEKLLYVTSRKAGTVEDFKFDEALPLDAMTENLPWNDTVGDREVKRSQVYNFYCINPSDLSMPIIVTFKGMSLRNGKVLNTMAFVKSFIAGSFPPANHYLLKGVKTSNDRGTFVVISTEQGEKSTNEEIMAAAKWKKMLDSGEAKAHAEQAPAKETAQQF